MKKLLILFVSILLCVQFTGCVSDGSPTKEQAEQSDKGTAVSETQAENQDDVFGLNTTAVFDDLKITATELTESNGTDFFKPEDGKVFVGIKFTVENISDEEQYISEITLFDGYVDDIKCDYSVSASCAFDESLSGNLAPGKKLVGTYALEVPQDWATVEVDVRQDWLSGETAKFIFNK